MLIRDYIKSKFVGSKIHATCDCVVALDLTGVVVDVTFERNGIALHVRDEKTGKIVKVYDNHPKLNITQL